MLKKVAVIGAGAMGKNHIRLLSQMKNTKLVGIFDTDSDTRRILSKQYSCKSFDSYQEILQEVDAVSICSPSSTHYEISKFFIENGIHCLIEKPLSNNLKEAKKLVTLSQNSKSKILVGHVEQFNPAVMQLKKILAEGDFYIRCISSARLGMGGLRIDDTGVIDDIMIHDIDIILSIINEGIRDVCAHGLSTTRLQNEDLCVANIQFDSGVIANLQASRITHKRSRKLQVDTDKGLFSLDYFTQELEFFHHRQDAKELDPLSNLGAAVLDTKVEKVMVRRSEPLHLEITHFLELISEKTRKPQVSIEQAYNSLEIANIIKESLNKK